MYSCKPSAVKPTPSCSSEYWLQVLSDYRVVDLSRLLDELDEWTRVRCFVLMSRILDEGIALRLSPEMDVGHCYVSQLRVTAGHSRTN